MQKYGTKMIYSAKREGRVTAPGGPGPVVPETSAHATAWLVVSPGGGPALGSACGFGRINALHHCSSTL